MRTLARIFYKATGSIRVCAYYINVIQRQENEKYNNIFLRDDIMYVNAVAPTRNRRSAKRYRKKIVFIFSFSFRLLSHKTLRYRYVPEHITAVRFEHVRDFS